MRPHFVRHLAEVDVEAGLVLAHESVAQGHGVVIEVTAADVEEPRHLVQRGDDQDVALVLVELGADEVNLIGD